MAGLGPPPPEPTVKLDLAGSTQTQSFTEFFKTRAVRRGLAKNLTNDRNKNRQAILIAVDEAGPFHHNIVDLPLSTITAQSFGKDKARLRINYRHSLTDISFPTVPAFILGEMQTVQVSIPLYNSWTDLAGVRSVDSVSGLPANSNPLLGILASDSGAALRSQQYTRSAWRIWIPTVLNSNPGPSVFSLTNTVNNNCVSFGSFIISPFSVRFDGIKVKPFVRSTQAFQIPSHFRISFRVEYIFTIIPFGFYHQVPYAPGQPVPPNGNTFTTWQIRSELVYEPLNFAGAFPTHA